MANLKQFDNYMKNLIVVSFKSFVCVCVSIVVIVLISLLPTFSDSIIIEILGLSIAIYTGMIIAAALLYSIVYKEDLFKKWWGI